MVAVYPKAGSRYKRHTDNPNHNGRKLTVILYLNPEWTPADGGALRIFHKQQAQGSAERGRRREWEAETVEGAEEVAETVEPLHNRLLVFWSDERCPHEVSAVEVCAAVSLLLNITGLSPI